MIQAAAARGGSVVIPGGVSRAVGKSIGANVFHTSEWGWIMSEIEALNEAGGPTVRTGAGRRSVQVEVYNNVDATLTIGSVAKPNDADWIDGEKPKVDDSLEPQRSQTWGVYNADATNVDVEATVQLIGYGNSPLPVRFFNLKNGTSGVDPAVNDVLKITSRPLSGGDKAHARYRVDIQLKS
ncbi:hypothetical protein D3877_24075 [Azospirillum cavernae]|uniref:Uncharacterized protein n=2 Tax=Azospirillum cavernae TaxID=2320860 RepID=A0A418VPL4_9PROT|nr:hypothetical protein D3877_24075 [Azospirillum cavernae]